MRIVIDLQSAQTESRFRGIGRYSLSLTKAIARKCGDHEIILALSGLFPETIEPIRGEFADLLPQENFRVWHTPGPVCEREPDNVWRREAGELIREAFLASLKPDLVHIMSLFEGYVDNAVTSIGRLDKSTPISVMLYDLIPLLNSESYLKPNHAYEQHYLKKISFLRQTLLALAISESSRQEGLDCLGLTSKTIVNVNGAADDWFKPLTLNDNQENSLRNKYNIKKSVVLYAGDADERKNLPRLIRAYAKLPMELRKTHQLVFVGKLCDTSIIKMNTEAKSAGLCPNELVITGYITNDELVKLYNICTLFIFPSWHEGFGLPALEAMSCGAPVLGSNTSSLPEIIGNKDALFNPFSEDDIARKLTYTLTNKNFRDSLSRQGLKRAQQFSWDTSASLALSSFEQLHAEQQQRIPMAPTASRPKMAYISPLPPEKSGISGYSAALIPELARYYDIDVIVAQNSVTDPRVNTNCQIRSVESFKANANSYERVLYHFGNSHFHEHMVDLLDKIPGVVVLHDFFLSGVYVDKYQHGGSHHEYAHELYESHGYKAAHNLLNSRDIQSAALNYPCNVSILRAALNVIVHSLYSQSLARAWYFTKDSESWAVIPLIREPALELGRSMARQALGLHPDQFIVCSFGMVAPTKLNQRLLDAWLASSLSNDKNCLLIFVGENHGGEYGQLLFDTIRQGGLAKRVRITGWLDEKAFRYYLAAADIGVQLRTLSRGESSAAVFDCMNYGLPTIVNANGSLAELPEDAVWKLQDEFNDDELIDALQSLWQDPVGRKWRGERAREIAVSHHSPQDGACRYAEAIERFYCQSRTSMTALIESLDAPAPNRLSEFDYFELAKSIAQNHPIKYEPRKLLLDISATCRNDLKTGIERVARSILHELVITPPDGYRVEPVYLCESGGRWNYRYARAYTFDLLGCPAGIADDEPVDVKPEDIVLGLDLFGQGLIDAHTYLDKIHRDGIRIYFLVFDLLPVNSPHFFPAGADEVHANWMKTIAKYDGGICISESVAKELEDWIRNAGIASHQRFDIFSFHLGADIENSRPSHGMPVGADIVLASIKANSSFLMIGTIEPRKGHDQVLSAFELLWAAGFEANLVIVGREGWKGLPDEARRTIPHIVNRLQNHPEINKRLFWLSGASDEYLNKIYESSSCLIAASEGEGFGLPLIEAAKHNLPIIARDIPVFREVAGQHAYFFNGSDPSCLSSAICDWIALYREDRHPKSDTMPWFTWRQSVAELIGALLK